MVKRIANRIRQSREEREIAAAQALIRLAHTDPAFRARMVAAARRELANNKVVTPTELQSGIMAARRRLI